MWRTNGTETHSTVPGQFYEGHEGSGQRRPGMRSCARAGGQRSAGMNLRGARSKPCASPGVAPNQNPKPKSGKESPEAQVCLSMGIRWEIRAQDQPGWRAVAPGRGRVGARARLTSRGAEASVSGGGGWPGNRTQRSIVPCPVVETVGPEWLHEL